MEVKGWWEKRPQGRRFLPQTHAAESQASKGWEPSQLTCHGPSDNHVVTHLQPGTEEDMHMVTAPACGPALPTRIFNSSPHFSVSCVGTTWKLIMQGGELASLAPIHRLIPLLFTPH